MGIEKYWDILDLPHHVSATRAHRTMVERAAQFSPFAALTGYEDAIEETGRRTENMVQLDEDAIALLDEQLRQVVDRIREQPTVEMTFFQPDVRKEGGSYVTLTAQIRKLDPIARTLTTVQGRTVPIDSLVSLSVLSEN
ncbi:MAG: hypothetical protein ACI4I5_05095 [Acutalibacteraceae bacterium]